jgi:acyl-coenzyme A thioesterase PaaI-like protein
VTLEKLDTAADGSVVVTEGEFAGWHTWPRATFETRSGPFYYRQERDGRIRCAFRPGRQHENGMDSIDGGCLMTFADFSLFAFASREVGTAPAVTVSFHAEFIDAAREGELIEAEGQVVRAGRSLIFLRGTLRCDDRTLMTYSGMVKRAGHHDGQGQGTRHPGNAGSGNA